MSEVQPIADPTPIDQNQKAKPKRSPVERALVWGGILVLLIVVGWELQAQRSYNSTLAGLEETFDAGTTLKEADLPSHIRGFAVREEEKTPEGRALTMRWPSLFRTYKLRLPITLGNTLCVVETESGHVDQMNEVPTKPIKTSAVATDN